MTDSPVDYRFARAIEQLCREIMSQCGLSARIGSVQIDYDVLTDRVRLVARVYVSRQIEDNLQDLSGNIVEPATRLTIDRHTIQVTVDARDMPRSIDPNWILRCVSRQYVFLCEDERLRQSVEARRRLVDRELDDLDRPAAQYHDYRWEQIRAYSSISAAQARNLLFGNFAADDHVGDQAAQKKGLDLLLEHLTAAQKEEYERTKAFTVTGSKGGRYRIKHGRQMNIDVLDSRGHRKAGICFLPAGQLVAGDCMLAQKLALETDEDAALAVANRFQ